ncbi:GvpL/GvpF family gas vesicle protein [Micromonospora zhanjiangensis]
MAGSAGAIRELIPGHPMLRVELTGPWPPYSFTELDDVEATR